MNTIFVLAEHRNNALRDVTFEMLHKASVLARETSSRVTAVLLGHDCNVMAEALCPWADEVITADHETFAAYNAEPYLAALSSLIAERAPSVFVMAHSATGMDLAPALSVRVNAPLVTDCMDFSLEAGTFTARRQMYGGKVDVRVTAKPAPTYLVTQRGGSFPAQQAEPKSGEIVPLPLPPLSGLRDRKFVRYTEAETGGVDISGSDILVSVGRGIGKPENLPLAEELAKAIGAPLACSRPVADSKWLPKSCQVGTSGKTVHPKVYLALGISGAFQHQAGMKNSGTIIAVNKDGRAPIFKVAHFGIVEDLFKVLPVLTEKVKALKG